MKVFLRVVMRNLKSLALGWLVACGMTLGGYGSSDERELNDLLLPDVGLCVEQIFGQTTSVKNPLLYSNGSFFEVFYSGKDQEKQGCCCFKFKNVQTLYYSNRDDSFNQVIVKSVSDRILDNSLERITVNSNQLNRYITNLYFNIFADQVNGEETELSDRMACLTFASSELFRMRSESQNYIQQVLGLSEDQMRRFNSLIKNPKFEFNASYTCWLGTLSYSQKGQKLNEIIQNIIGVQNEEDMNQILKYILFSVFLKRTVNDFHIFQETYNVPVDRLEQLFECYENSKHYQI